MTMQLILFQARGGGDIDPPHLVWSLVEEHFFAASLNQHLSCLFLDIIQGTLPSLLRPSLCMYIIYIYIYIYIFLSYSFSFSLSFFLSLNFYLPGVTFPEANTINSLYIYSTLTERRTTLESILLSLAI